MTVDEYATFEALAGDRSVSAWARDVLRQAANERAGEQVLLEELLALRTIVVNVQFAVTTGARITADDMRQLIARADAEKQELARLRRASPTRRSS